MHLYAFSKELIDIFSALKPFKPRQQLSAGKILLTRMTNGRYIWSMRQLITTVIEKLHFNVYSKLKLYYSSHRHHHHHAFCIRLYLDSKFIFRPQMVDCGLLG